MPSSSPLRRQNRHRSRVSPITAQTAPSHPFTPRSVEEEDRDFEIDLTKLWELVKKNIWLLASITLICGICTGLFTWLVIPEKYASSGTLFLTPKVTEGLVDYTSLNSNQKLVNNVVNLLTQDNIMTMVADEVGIETAAYVRDTLTITNIPDTEIITVTATTKDPKLSQEIAKDTIDIFVNEMSESLNVQNIKITDEPKLENDPVSPSIPKNSLIGALVGFLGVMIYLIIRLLTDKRLKTSREVEAFLGLPVYIELPEIQVKKGK